MTTLTASREPTTSALPACSPIVDGIEVGATQFQSPYSVQWNSTWLSDGQHSVVGAGPRRGRQQHDVGGGGVHHPQQRHRPGRRRRQHAAERRVAHLGPPGQRHRERRQRGQERRLRRLPGCGRLVDAVVLGRRHAGLHHRPGPRRRWWSASARPTTTRRRATSTWRSSSGPADMPTCAWAASTWRRGPLRRRRHLRHRRRRRTGHLHSQRPGVPPPERHVRRRARHRHLVHDLWRDARQRPAR